MAERVYGRLKWWNSEKRFGFITPDDGDEDIFCGAGAFRFANIEPRQGQRLTYVIGFDRNGRTRAADLAVDEAEAA